MGYNQIAAKQGRYLGSLKTDSLGATRDSGGLSSLSGSAAKRYLWNYGHRRPRSMITFDTTTSWTNNGNGTWSAMNAGAIVWTHQFLIGVPGDPVDASLSCYCNSVSSSATGAWAIAIDSTTVFDARRSSIGDFTFANGGAFVAIFADTPQQAGSHFTQGIMTTTNTNTVTFFGTHAPGGGAVGINSGMKTFVWG